MWVDGAVLVRGICVGADRTGGVMPLLDMCLENFALQLCGGLLPGQTGAVAHLNSVLTRALDLVSLGEDRSGE